MSYNVKSSVARIQTDPLRNFKFAVQIALNNPNISNIANLGFMSVSGLNVTTEVIPYREGGMNTTTQKMPGQSDFAPITLAKGLAIGDSAMMQWMRELFTVMQGTGTGAPGNDFRATVTIDVLDHPVTQTTNVPIKARYTVYNAWPTAVAFSDLDAGANAIIVQQMTLAHEGFEFSLADQLGSSSL
jgi:phage tail-like protein